MNSLFTRSLVILCAVLLEGRLEAQTNISTRNGDWNSTFGQMAPQIQKLMHAIKTTDMHPYLLSELKNHTLLVTDVNVLEDSFVVVAIEDGHGGEKVAFDFDEQGGWTIIRRSPVGDWKPKEQRKGDRLTHIPFPTETAAPQPGTKKP
ncbi:hypothetical protein [Prosthecobacter sp.]|uniref:hypothetical protein n=1 Tax=Prosthecobacter sp. TaxID=1965333 RepID=UPI003783C685